jgi:hypothetical protein
MSDPDWQEIAKELGTSDKERLAIWMIQHGFATHGDNLDDLLHELKMTAPVYSEPPGEAYREIIREKDAEIERLKALVKYHCEQQLKSWKKERVFKALITELCDALGHYALLNDFEKSLIQRAREAIK